MDYSAFDLTLVPALISCVAAVISYLNAKKPASVELQQTVDEMLALVEKMMKEQRKVKMQNVRAASKDSGDNHVPASVDPMQVQPVNSKADLRRLASQRGIIK